MLGVNPNPRLWPNDELLREYAAEIGREDYFKPTEVGIFFGDPEQVVPDPYFDGKGPARRGCDHSGRCMVGCRTGGKNSLDRNYLYLAEALGVKIVPETSVTAVQELPSGGYKITTQKSTNSFRATTQSWTAKGVVFSAGALGTNKLLLECRRRKLLPKLSDQVGKIARTNSEILLGVTSKNKNARYCEGIAITSSLFIDDVTHVEPVRYPQGSDAMFWLSALLTDGGSKWTRPLKFLRNCLLHPVDFVRTLVPFGWAQKTIILLVMQTLDNKMELILKRRRLLPWSRRVSSKPEVSDIPTYIPAANQAARAIAKKINGIAKNAITEVLFNIPLTAHIMGGCVIGKDAQHGVVDKHCNVFGYENMYIMDGSIIPANLGVNPGLTITALAEYAMSQVPSKTKRSE